MYTVLYTLCCTTDAVGEWVRSVSHICMFKLFLRVLLCYLAKRILLSQNVFALCVGTLMSSVRANLPLRTCIGVRAVQHSHDDQPEQSKKRHTQQALRLTRNGNSDV
jgi:hypothetical protein